MNCIICAIAKNENPYIYEWAEYHLQIGFSQIHIYDNNDVDGERISDVFNGTPIEKHITLHDVCGKKYMQKKVYQECYDNEAFDWCAFIDIDEFITFENPRMTIAQFLDDKATYDAVHLNWMCYGDSSLVKKGARPVTERFRKPWKKDVYYTYFNHHENEHIKSIIRSGQKIDWISGDDSNPHTPKGLKEVCNAVGLQVLNEPFAPICHDGAYIRHYITKTVEEYAAKIERQCADCDALFYSYAKFFRVNIPTVRKLWWLKRHHPKVSLWECINDHIRYAIVNHNLPMRQFVKAYKRQMYENAGYEYVVTPIARRDMGVRIGDSSLGGG